MPSRTEARAVAQRDWKRKSSAAANNHGVLWKRAWAEKNLSARRGLARLYLMKQRHIGSWQLFLDNTLRWRDLPKPTIAQVQGYCIFGGYMFASAMDLIVASEDAMFLPSLTQYFSAPWDIGVRKAKEILFQSRFIDASEALSTGLVNLVVPRTELEKETLALANRIAETDAFTLRLMKFAINLAQDEMGFRNAVRNAHSHHFLTRVQEYSKRDEGAMAPVKRLPGVEQALRKSRPSAHK
jgi:enoyl-CoA hydratase/carnithine racemase